jgi:hypothetical protein
MGVQVQINPGFSAVYLPDGLSNHYAGDLVVLTNAEYAGLPSADTRAVTLVETGLPDPVRAATPPVSLSDAVSQSVSQANTYTETNSAPINNSPSATVEGDLLFWYGNSYGCYTTNAEVVYTDRLRGRIIPWLYGNYSVTGSLAADVCAYAYGTITSVHQGAATSSHTTSTTSSSFGSSTFLGGFVGLDIVRNDAGLDGTTALTGTTAKSRAGFSNHLHALVSLFRSASRVENNAGSGVTRVGTWTSSASTSSSGGNISSTATSGDHVTYVITVPTGGAPVQWVTLALDDGALSQNGSTFSITVDGGTAITGTISNQSRKSGHTPNNGFGQMAVDLGTLAAGSHTIVVTNTGTTGEYLYDDCIMISTLTPPTVILMKAAQLTPTGYLNGYPTGSASYVTDKIYNALVDTEVAKYTDGSVISIDPNAYVHPIYGSWDNTSMIGDTDGLSVHLNDKGNRFYADMIMASLNALTPRSGLVRL